MIKEKTILEWLDEIPDEQISEAAKSNCRMNRAFGIGAESLLGALGIAFPWGDTREGCGFWCAVHDWLANVGFPKPDYPAPTLDKERERSALPTDAADRKAYPIYSGFMQYFPDAIAAVSHLSWKGNQQHHPDKPLHWDMNKSGDELDCLMRHTIDEIKADSYDVVIDEAARRAWRAMADLQRKLTGKCSYLDARGMNTQRTDA